MGSRVDTLGSHGVLRYFVVFKKKVSDGNNPLCCRFLIVYHCGVVYNASVNDVNNIVNPDSVVLIGPRWSIRSLREICPVIEFLCGPLP